MAPQDEKDSCLWAVAGAILGPFAAPHSPQIPQSRNPMLGSVNVASHALVMMASINFGHDKFLFSHEIGVSEFIESHFSLEE